MIRYLLRPAIVLFIGAVFSGCEVINPEEDKPGFVTIQKPTFSAGTFGSDSHEILSGWVFVDGKLLGVFDLPATVPILSEGETRITVNAGIVADGQRATRDLYPFYASYNETLQIVPEQSYTITPAFTYGQGVNNPVREDFEISMSQMEATAPYTLQRKQIAPSDSLFFESGGSYVGLVTSLPDTTTPFSILSTSNDVSIVAGRDVFLEFDLRSSIPVSVGVQYTVNGSGFEPATGVIVFKSSEWKKYYVNLLNEVAIPGNSIAKFKVFFYAEPGATGQDYVAVDNIRLVHY